MRSLNLTERETVVLTHALNAVRLHRDPVVFVYAARDAANNDLLRVVADVIEKLHTAPRAKAAPTGGRHRWPRHGNVCEVCGARRERIQQPDNSVRTFYALNGVHYRTFPCPGGSTE